MTSRMPEAEPVVTRAGELRERFEDLVSYLEGIESGRAQGLPEFMEVEGRVRGFARTIECAADARALAAYEFEDERVEVGGKVYQKMNQPTEATYYGQAGPFEVTHDLYRLTGVHNGPTIVPMELRAGVVEGLATPAAADACCWLAQMVPSREAEVTTQRFGLLGLSRSSLERLPKAVGQRWDVRRLEAEDHLTATLEIPAEATAVAAGVDRFAVAMEEPKERGPGRPRKDAPKRPVEVNHRMAYGASLTFIDSAGKPLGTTRYARMAGEGARASITGSVAGDLHALLTERPELKLATLGDGAKEVQDILDDATRGLAVDGQGVDFWHTVEKLGAAVAAAGRPVAEKVDAWCDRLLEDDHAIERIGNELRTWALNYEDVPQPLHAAITYIDNHADRMRYASLRRAGLPIGSGHTEATGKTIYSTRMKRPGARWKRPTGQAIADLRALATSTRWDDGMNFLLATYRGQIKKASAAA